jgi:hypothetical protein
MHGPPGAEILKMIEERFARRAVTPTLFLSAVAFPIVELAVIVTALAIIWTLALAPIAFALGTWISLARTAPPVAVTTAALAIAAVLIALLAILVGVVERRVTSRLLDAYLRHIAKQAFQ